MHKLTIVLGLCVTSLNAQEALDGPAFEVFSDGQIITYSSPDTDNYGAELHLPDHRVIWSTQNGRCVNGFWFEKEDQICFRYEDTIRNNCWTLYTDGDNLIGYFNRSKDQVFTLRISPKNELHSCAGLSS